MTSAEPPVNELPPRDSGPARRARVTVGSRNGLHLRPSTEFARIASTSGCDVRVEMDGRDANGASVIELAMLAARHGVELEIIVSGDDDVAEETLSALVALVGRRTAS